MPTHASTPQRSPEHVNALYERGGSCTSMHANTPQRSPEHVNALYEGGAVAAHQCSYAFQVLGAEHIQENPGRFL